jgi:hypothetical protein
MAGVPASCALSMNWNRWPKLIAARGKTGFHQRLLRPFARRPRQLPARSRPPGRRVGGGRQFRCERAPPQGKRPPVVESAGLDASATDAVARPRPGATTADWLDHVQAPHTEVELAALRRSLERGSPYGAPAGSCARHSNSVSNRVSMPQAVRAAEAARNAKGTVCSARKTKRLGGTRCRDFVAIPQGAFLQCPV